MKALFGKIALFMLIVGLLSACAPQPAAIATITSQPTESPTNTPLPTETAAPIPTDTLLPSDTASPTDLAAPTESVAATQPDVQGTTVSFANDILPIIESRCINCHGGDRTEEGLVMLTYTDLMAGSDNGPVIMPGDAVNSLLAELVSTQKCRSADLS